MVAVLVVHRCERRPVKIAVKRPRIPNIYLNIFLSNPGVSLARAFFLLEADYFSVGPLLVLIIIINKRVKCHPRPILVKAREMLSERELERLMVTIPMPSRYSLYVHVA